MVLEAAIKAAGLPLDQIDSVEIVGGVGTKTKTEWRDVCTVQSSPGHSWWFVGWWVIILRLEYSKTDIMIHSYTGIPEMVCPQTGSLSIHHH